MAGNWWWDEPRYENRFVVGKRENISNFRVSYVSQMTNFLLLISIIEFFMFTTLNYLLIN